MSYIDDLIQAAFEHRASDLFISENDMARLKVNGELADAGDRTLSRDEMAEFWRRCGADPDKMQDHDSAYVAPFKVRFRVNLHKHKGQLGAVLRQIKTAIPNMEWLGLPEHVILPWLQMPSGLLLVTGPTGSGKSTTLASCLEWINNNRSTHIVTIEDPIEYEFENKRSFFTQREVGTDTPSFTTGLRSALRQAPDVILLGEIRDADTAQIALQAAETGHLVFATLHSSTVIDTLDRFIHLVPEGSRESVLSLLSYQLIGIITQQLLPNASGNGVALVCEHLTVQAAAKDWIREKKFAELGEFLRRTDNPGNSTFLNSLADAFKTGKVSYETALEHSGNAYEFNRILRGIS